jgi:hypothetical protein
MAQIQSLIIAGLVFGAIAIGVGSFAGDFFTSNNYGYGVSINSSAYLNQTAGLNERVEAISTNLRSTPTNIPLIDVPLNLIAGAINSLLLLLELPVIFDSLISGTASYVGAGYVPVWFTNVLGAIVGVLILFGVIAVLVKKEL